MRNPRWPILGYEDLEDKWEAETVEGVFQSGDLARRDSDGYYGFAGRSDDVIVTAGYNVGPSEVENIVSDISGVRDVAVVVDGGTVARATLPRSEMGNVRRNMLRDKGPGAT